MNIKQLKYFITIVEEGTISAAAKKLYMSQPPLSKQILQLENELGCTLFQRTPRQILLTEAGKFLYEKAKAVVLMMTTTQEEMHTFNKENAGIIRVGITSSISSWDIVQLFAKFAGKYPKISFDIYESNTYQILEKLNAKTIHFGIVRTPFFSRGFKKIILSRNHLTAIGRKTLFGKDQKIITLGELAEKPLIIYRRWENIVYETFRENNLAWHLKFRNDDARTSLFLAKQGVGVALLPESTVSFMEDAMTCCSIEGDLWPTDIVLLYDEHAYLPNCAKLLLDRIISQYQ